jgi:hypothetical protein
MFRGRDIHEHKVPYKIYLGNFSQYLTRLHQLLFSDAFTLDVKSVLNENLGGTQC